MLKSKPSGLDARAPYTDALALRGITPLQGLLNTGPRVLSGMLAVLKAVNFGGSGAAPPLAVRSTFESQSTDHQIA
jgi:hypothetical protein